MARPLSPKTALLSLSMAALLLTSGCTPAATSDDSGQNSNPAPPVETETQGQVYEFESDYFQADGELTIKIPEQLLEMMDEEKKEKLAYTQVTFKAIELDSNKCGISLKIDDFTDHGLEITEQYSQGQATPAPNPTNTSPAYYPGTSEWQWVQKCSPTPLPEPNKGTSGWSNAEGWNFGSGINGGISVMKSGTIGIQARTDGFIRDVQGNWIED